MKIQIYQRSAFGVLRYYVADTTQAAQVSALTGQPSLTFAQVKALQELGFAVKGVADPRASLASDLFALGASAMHAQSTHVAGMSGLRVNPQGR